MEQVRAEHADIGQITLAAKSPKCWVYAAQKLLQTSQCVIYSAFDQNRLPQVQAERSHI